MTPAAPEAASLAALVTLAVATTFTPGPNNAMLSASGATFGLRRTIPHAQGVTWGFPLMVFAVALGLGEAFRESAVLRETLRWGGAALMLWLAWRIATAEPPGRGKGRSRPLSFVEAAGFQWINPKAWMMSLAVTSQFVDGSDSLRDAAVAAAVFAGVGFFSSHGWAAFGAALGRWLGEGMRLRVFNAAMGAMIVAGVAALLMQDLAPPPAAAG